MIILKSDAEIEAIEKSCRIAAATLKMIEPYVKPGVTTLELNDICHEYIAAQGAISAPLNYHGFPKSICTSVNEVVCHGIPSSKVKLKEGDIINIDITTIFEGYHGDVSKTFCVGAVKKQAKNLVQVTQECLEKGIMAVRCGGRTGDIGAAIQEHAEAYGYSIVREYVGHGIGKNFHEDPQITHFGTRGTGMRLEKGLTFTIEPMVNEGHWKTVTRKDGWTAATVDGSLSAQFEHTIAILHDESVRVLTREL